VRSNFFHAHAHSRYSALDGTAPLQDMVDWAIINGQPALALTDHGNMSGCIELYKLCKEYELAPFPGIEAYVCESLDKDEERFHVGLLALNYDGYRALVRLSTRSHQPDGHFYRKPRISWDELKAFGDIHGDNVAITTGCYFGLVVQALVRYDEYIARSWVESMASHFQHTFVELQMHNTVHPDGRTDWDIAVELYKIASDLGLPVIAGQDSHYCRKSDKPAHEMMKRLGYHSSDDSEILFPGNSYHMASTGWMQKQYQGLRGVWSEVENGMGELLRLNQMSMPAIDNYKFNIPVMSRVPNKELRRMVEAGRTVDTSGVNYTNRINYELDVIRQMGFTNYFLLIGDIVEFMNASKIMFNTRGSANGSLVCYLLGISHVDPLVWGVSFDRFLHQSRKKPPDIDIDVERDRRQEVIDYLSNNFDVTQIGTFMRMTENADRGAIFAKYLGYKRRVLGDQFKSSPFARIDSLSELQQVAPEDMQAVRRLAEMEVCSSAGTHAAGLVLSDKNYPLDAYVPTMLIGGQNGNTVTQMSMDDVEAAGFVKVDLLGLSGLTTVSRCLEAIGRDPQAGLDWIPLDDAQTCKSMSAGVVGTGVFQFEGYSTAIGARKMKIRDTKDCIRCLALFRPAALKSGHTDEYLARRKSKQPITYLHDVFKRATEDTFGVFIFQDQVIDVLRGLGMGFEDLNDMLKAVKASNNLIAAAKDTFDRIEPIFLKLCEDAGMTGLEPRQAWQKVLDFSDYGFNYAHATAYGLLGYRMAYLKLHYPIEFMCSLLETWAGSQKESQYTAEARRIGIRIRKVNVNKSGLQWSHDGTSLFRGFVSVKGIGYKTAMKLLDERNKGDFTSQADVKKRCGQLIYRCMDESNAMGDLPEEDESNG